MFITEHIPKHWQKPLLGILLATLACIAVFWQSWGTIEGIWAGSETYKHGYLVAPISIWLIWTRKNQYRYLQPAASLQGLLAIAVCGFIWLIGDLVKVQLVEQCAVVGILICSFWAILGGKVISEMLFPVMFLFLMVPFGEDYVPFLMEYTATFVVGMLRLTGMSVYREGLHFTLTSGNWSVVEACSGIRYLISSITLGAVYMYLNYSNYKKRAVFMLAAVLVPILANGLRAYMIVMIGHLSDMKLATGVDHLIYGWVFFGFVMTILFYIGSFWRDPPQISAPASDADSMNVTPYPYYWPLLSAIFLCFSVWPLALAWMIAQQAVNVEIPEQLTHPAMQQWHTVNAPDWGWEPEFQGIAVDARHFLGDGETRVAIYAANFGDESKGELISSQNMLLPQQDKTWQIIETSKIPINWPGDKPIEVNESVLDSSQSELLVLQWYKIGIHNTANSYYAKWLQLLKRLSGDASPELLMVLYTETQHDNYQKARENLQKIAEACCAR